MRSASRTVDRLTAGISKLLPILALLCLWTIFAWTGLYWGGAKIYESLWLYYVSGALWLLLGAHALLAWWQGRRVGGWVDLPVLVFLVYVAVWYRFTPIEFLTRIEGLWALTYAAVFLSVRYIFPQRGWMVVLLAGLLVVALICCSFAFSKFGQDVYLIWGEERPDYGVRISGFFGCPNHFGNYMVMASLAAVVLAGIVSFPWVLRIVLFYVAGMLSAGVFLSLSRGSYAAWLAGMMVVAGFFFFRSAMSWVWKLVLGLVAAAMVIGGFLVNRAAVFRGSQMTHDDFRFELFQESWKMWQQQPWFGFGPATFDYVHQQFHGPAFQARAYYPHNDYLNTLCDYGLVGLVIVLIFVVLLAFAFRCPKESTLTERQQDLAVLGWAGLAAMLVHSMTDFSFHIPACAVAFFTVMGVASSRTERQQRAPLCLPANFFFVGTALVAAYFLISVTWNTREAKGLLSYTDDGLVELEPDRMLLLADAARRLDSQSPVITVRAADALRVHVAELEEKINRLRHSGNPTETEAGQLADYLKQRAELGERALDFYQEAQKANVLDDTLKIKQGMVLDLMDRPQEAYLFYQQAIQDQPYNRFFSHVLGYHFMRIGNIAKAKECFTTVLQIGMGKRERNKEVLDQATQALQIIDRFEKQQAAPAPMPMPVPIPGTGPQVPPTPPAVVVPPPVEPETKTEPARVPATAPVAVPNPEKRPSRDAPILGPTPQEP